jgi:hypothetical protein
MHTLVPSRDTSNPTYSLIVALSWLLNTEAETLYSDLVLPGEQVSAINAMYS